MARQKKRWSTRDMTMTALMTVLICVCTWICIPGPIPVTLQTFAVFVAVELMGSRRAFWAVAAYLLMGAAGLPVFSGMAGGPGILMGPTGGYLWGFLVLPMISGAVTKLAGRVRLLRVLGMVLGLAACYALGTLWFVIVSDAGTAGWGTALAMCVLPFLIPDAVKLMLAMLLAEKLKRHAV